MSWAERWLAFVTNYNSFWGWVRCLILFSFTMVALACALPFVWAWQWATDDRKS